MSDGKAATLHLKVVSPRRLLVEADVEAVFLPTLEGQIGVFPGHRPLFVGIGKGKLVYREDGGGEEAVFIRGGYAQVQPEKVVVMTEVGEDDESDAAA